MRISALSYGAALFAAQLAMAQVGTDAYQYQCQQPTATGCPQATTTGCPQATTAAPCPCGVGVTRNIAAKNQQTSRLAAQMIQATDNARKAIENNDTTTANAQIDQAISLARQIQQMEPNRNIVPIYAELESTAVLQPVLQARAGGQTVAAAPQPRTDQAQPTGVVVEQTTGQFTFIGVNPSTSISHLEAAKMALNNNNPVAAHDALSAVENGVIAIQVAGDMPLVRARQNLALASNYEKQGRTQDAQAALDEAASALDNYAQSGGRYASQAQNLAQQIRSSEANISQQQPQQASTQIDNYWDQAAGWSQQS